MRTLKLTIAYDGTRYAGWQIQGRGAGGEGRGAREKPTVQGTLENVLRQILQEPVKVIGSGRTDAGVHALAQAAHITTHSRLASQRLLRSLNQLLPPDIAVIRIEETNGAFHARFSAVRKRYQYRVVRGPVVSPFSRPYVHHVPTPLNLALMRRELRALRGRHDFRAFARIGQGSRDAVRRLTDVQIVRRDGELRIEMEGTGFLHTMVRSIVGTLLDVGLGRLSPGTIRRMLKTGDRRLAGTTAPAKGLTLVGVTYREKNRRIVVRR